MSRSGRRVCLLTGAGGILGEAFCQRYRDKYDIAAVCRNRVPDVPSQFQEYRNPLAPKQAPTDEDHPVFVIRADLSEPNSLERVIDLTLARFGRIDVLVNNAANQAHGALLENDRFVNGAAGQLHLNVAVPLRLATLAARLYWRDRYTENRTESRSIVNVSSTAGLYIYRTPGQSLYSASKAALNFLTAHMAHEFQAIGIRVNALAPNSFPRIVATEAAADGIARLDAGDMTGKTLILDKNVDRLVP